jgi:hypothetical protein
MTRGALVGLLALSAMWWLPPLLDRLERRVIYRRADRRPGWRRSPPLDQHDRIPLNITRLTDDQADAITKHLPRQAIERRRR